MTRLEWGVDGERLFETGVDRGVLYISGQPGVPWNGLKAVRESPSGGSPQPFYVDGMKYANVATAEEFNASIEAFSSPVEFSECDGSRQLASGLFATQQPRKPFGLSYRTQLGNDVNGIGSAHKIHLVYNALASATGRDNATMAKTMDPLDLSWEITTRPPVATGYRPTAHFVINTSELSSIVLLDLEEILYGSAVTTPSLPSQADLIALLT